MPFFTTPATIASSSSGGDGTSIQNTKKRQADAVDGSLLRGSLEDLVRAKQQQTVPLADIRDVVMDHVLETLETDLKYTVFLICEDVVDLVLGDKDAQTTQTKKDGEAVVSNDGAVAAAATVAASAENPEVNTSSSGAMPFLDGTDSNWYRFHSQLSEGDSIPRCDATLLRMPVSKRDMEKEKKAAKKSVKMKIKKFKKITGENAKPSAEFYVLSPQELKVHVSSIPFDSPKDDSNSNNASEFLTTQPLPDGDARSQEQLLLALDCEMCKTTKGVELARLTLVDANEKVLIDEYVRPANPIVDYCTQYSGITFDIMEDTTNRLKDAQELFLKHVPAEAILVGHSIENDLQALKILHHRIIDTTALYPHPKGPPFRSALRFLASTYLNKTIQSGSDGHCSVEDAIATLQLVKMKIKHGPTFPSIEQEYKQKKVINELYRVKKTALIVDSLRACRSLSGGVAGAIPCEDNDKIAHTVVHQLTTGFPPNFTWARMRGTTRQEIACHVTTIQSQLPKHSCFVVVLARECSELRELHKLRTTRADPRCSLMWDKTMQAKLDAVARDAQHGLVHIYLK
uniref:Exonuclease domain-containing protein n=1 Tax=Globisporangium ultimum (strain ATCC 200006 / CBS 805.95 / DAOM BR144) TaxID=431595 RepID=K3X9M9_GLOUD